jgi:hypothetical protein
MTCISSAFSFVCVLLNSDIYRRISRRSAHLYKIRQDIYISRYWLTFNDFLVWQRSCWLVVPLTSFICPVGLKVYSCKHAVGLAILLNLYQVSDKTRVEPLGKRRRKGRPKKVNAA